VNVIGLTGRNMPAMAEVAELLLAGITHRGLRAALMLYVENEHQLAVIRLNQYGLTELWRIGPDPTRPALDRHADAFIDDSGDALSIARQVQAHLDRFTARLAPTHPRRAVQAASLAST
jgi:hypothetical protein